jgi:hypothetical protein
MSLARFETSAKSWLITTIGWCLFLQDAEHRGVVLHQQGDVPTGTHGLH